MPFLTSAIKEKLTEQFFSVKILPPAQTFTCTDNCIRCSEIDFTKKKSLCSGANKTFLCLFKHAKQQTQQQTVQWKVGKVFGKPVRKQIFFLICLVMLVNNGYNEGCSDRLPDKPFL